MRRIALLITCLALANRPVAGQVPLAGFAQGRFDANQAVETRQLRTSFFRRGSESAWISSVRDTLPRAEP